MTQQDKNIRTMGYKDAYPDEEWFKVVRLFKEGFNIPYIAKSVNRSEKSVTRKLINGGYSLKGRMK